MIRDPFGKEELYIAWMRCRYSIFQDVANFKIHSERSFYDTYIDQIILDLYHRLKNNQYSFSNKQIFLMPKSNGLIRKKSFMEIEDQIVSHAILNFIGRKIDSKFYYWSCANRIPRKKTKFSAQTFIPYFKQYNKFLNHTVYKIKAGNRWVCETDIVSYFDHIDHDLLMNMLKQHLKDEIYSYTTEILIPDYLKSFYSLKGESKKSIKGIPQGGALAYFLSNLYLNELDHKMKDFTKFNYIRYVDDIRIMGETKEDVERSLLHLQAHLWELGLEINAGKTKVYEVEDEGELDEFREEQEKKLSPLQAESDEDMYRLFQQYKDDITEKEKLPQAKGDFKELEKLRKRKINFATNSLIRKGDPASFPLLVSQMDTKPEKVTYFLEKLFNYRFKEKKLSVVSINNTYLERPYEAYVGAALANLHNWNIKLRDELSKVIPSDTGIVELYLLNSSKSRKVEPFILTTVINKSFNRFERINPYLINSILYHMSRSTVANGIGFSTRFKSVIINKIIEKNIYMESNCGQFIVDAFLRDSTLLERFKNSNEKVHTDFFDFLRRDSQELYKLLIAKDFHEVIVEPNEGYFTLNHLHSTFNSAKDIYIFLKKVTTLIRNNNQYMNNPTFVNPKNLWVKTSIYHDMEVKLNPNPVIDRSLYLSAPEDFFDRENVKNECKISFMIGLITFSLLLKEMDKINSFNITSLQFNPKRVWKNNRDEFKAVFSKDFIVKSPIQEGFYDLLSIIEKLTKKNPRSRLSILNFNTYQENKKGDERKIMKFFVSHSTKDKGRITPYINLIESSEKKHKALVDTHEFIPGKSIIGEITKKIDESDIVIVFYSSNVVENFKWVMEEVEYSIQIEKPFVCVLLDDIPVPPLLKGEKEKLHFVHKDNVSMKEIQSFLYKLEGVDVEEIKSELNLDKVDPANKFIQYLNEKEVTPLNMLLNDKYFNIFDVLTKNRECKLAPANIFKTHLDGTDINASPYQEIIDTLKFLELIETQDNGSFVTRLKLQNSSFHSCIREAKERYGLYWRDYFKDAIKIEEYKNHKK